MNESTHIDLGQILTTTVQGKQETTILNKNYFESKH